MRTFDWQVGYSRAAETQPEEWYPAAVPGAAQLDYARAKGWPPYYQGCNARDYRWMEDVYWRYRTPLRFTLQSGQRAALCFDGLDYRYRIFINGELLLAGEGMFAPVRLDVTRFAGGEALLEALFLPCPKAEGEEGRAQARESCKPAACYGWDWHPRLISTGIWDEVRLEIADAFAVTEMEARYTLSDALDSCRVRVRAHTTADGAVRLVIRDGEEIVAAADGQARGGEALLSCEVAHPRLWYPQGYGEQARYTLAVYTLRADGSVAHCRARRIGFRRARLVMNEGSWKEPSGFPKSRSDAPCTLEINGRRLFAKGSNWVNAQVFPGEANRAHYERLLQRARDAHMNLLRVWGGGFVNKESFYDLCDEMGIMVWQEFPLACNEYPDSDAYLRVLEQEARAIIRRLRTHPSVVIWCGGNELFNNWSRMTDQHHALRLLNALCYEEDRFTPFLPTSPLNGMGHGHYVAYDETLKKESLAMVRESRCGAYTEFGCPGMPERAYLETFMTPEDIADCRPENPVWREHHGFGAWRNDDAWVRRPEAAYFFGGWDGVDDLCRKMAFIQAMSYRSLFEEMRRQWPRCAMALNWCLNEPWPTCANNSLLSWPDVPRPAYDAVREALRPRMASLGVDKQLWRGGEEFTGEIWILNDSPEALPGGTVRVFYALNGGETAWGALRFAALPAQTNRRCGRMSVPLPKEYAGTIRVYLRVEGRAEMDGVYTYLCRPRGGGAAVRGLNL